MKPRRIRIDWLPVLLHGLQVLAFCCVIAVFTTMVWPEDGYAHQLVYSVSIGMLTWLTIEFGRLLVPPEHCHRSAESGSHGWPRGWRGLVLTAAGIAVGFLGGTRLAPWLLGDPTHTPQRDLTLALLVTIAAGVVASFYFHARSRQAGLQAEIAAAERDASQARLMLLQSQLEPHMLFNTLANLRALIGVDPAAAQQMLDRLDDFLRSTLEALRATSHPLAAEFDRLHDYLALMAIRMGPRLAFKLDLPDELGRESVPPLILQPLVENAIRHGLEPQRDGGRIEISATREGDRLLLTVSDTGTGFDTGAPLPQGRFGQAQVIERVASAYGDRGRVEIQSRPGAGTTVRIVLPLAP
ncbi:MAG: histidine kinase [Burkholderiaceae bacterium]